MSLSEELSDLALKDRLVCFECVEDTYLRSQIETNGRDGTCFYCRSEGRAFSIEEMSNFVENALSDHFWHVTLDPNDDLDNLDDPLEDAPEAPAGPTTLGQPVAEVLKCAAGISECIGKDILCVLAERHRDDTEEGILDYGEGPFDDSARYGKFEPGSTRYDAGQWRAFERGIRTETRFFNRSAEETLRYMFQGIDGHNTINGRPVIVDAGLGAPLSVLYRARAFQSESNVREAMKRPERDVGPPPPEKAVAGRMNAAGISVFYGATDPDVALAEVQPPVGSKVLIGHFDLLKPIRLLDFGALEHVGAERGSLFDPDYTKRLQRTAFLRGLSHRIARPVMPDDRDLDYIPTQAIADFLANALDPPLDGILYSSVQVGPSSGTVLARGKRTDKRNVVLFHSSSSVQALDIPDDEQIKVDDDDFFGFGIGDGVSDSPDLTYIVSYPPGAAPAPDQADATLRLSALEVRSVRGIRLDTRGSRVDRIWHTQPRDGT